MKKVHILILLINLLLSPSCVLAFSDLVYQAQKKLNELGYNAGKADGIMGENTKSAISKYQKKNNFSITGEIDHKTKESLGLKSSIVIKKTEGKYTKEKISSYILHKLRSSQITVDGLPEFSGYEQNRNYRFSFSKNNCIFHIAITVQRSDTKYAVYAVEINLNDMILLVSDDIKHRKHKKHRKNSFWPDDYDYENTKTFGIKFKCKAGKCIYVAGSESHYGHEYVEQEKTGSDYRELGINDSFDMAYYIGRGGSTTKMVKRPSQRKIQKSLSDSVPYIILRSESDIILNEKFIIKVHNAFNDLVKQCSISELY